MGSLLQVSPVRDTTESHCPDCFCCVSPVLFGSENILFWHSLCLEAFQQAVKLWFFPPYHLKWIWGISHFFLITISLTLIQLCHCILWKCRLCFPQNFQYIKTQKVLHQFMICLGDKLCKSIVIFQALLRVLVGKLVYAGALILSHIPSKSNCFIFPP